MLRFTDPEMLGNKQGPKDTGSPWGEEAEENPWVHWGGQGWELEGYDQEADGAGEDQKR